MNCNTEWILDDFNIGDIIKTKLIGPNGSYCFYIIIDKFTESNSRFSIGPYLKTYSLQNKEIRNFHIRFDHIRIISKV